MHLCDGGSLSEGQCLLHLLTYAENPVLVAPDRTERRGKWTMYLSLALGSLLMVLLGAFFWMRRNRQASTESPEAGPLLSPQAQLHKLQHSGRFWGVSVESHCRASSPLAGRRFAFDSPPMLPVEGCKEASCHCCLRGLPDRRKQRERRSGEDRRHSLRMESSDRRSQRPRRQDDRNSWVTYSHL